MKKEPLILGLLAGLLLVSIVLSAVTSSDRFALSSSSGSGVAVLNVTGPISAQSGGFSNPGLDEFVEQLYDIERNKQVKALVLRIDSPGGTVGASQELYREILKFKKRTKMPVIASIADVGASGAYWVALAGDRIYANPGSLVGSIGVIVKSLDLSEVYKRYGIGMTVFKSVPYKDMLSGWRDVSSRESSVVYGMLANIQAQFEAAVVEGRRLSPAQAHRLADGRVFTGEQAKQKNLIDSIGGFRDAIAYAAKKAGIKGKPRLLVQEKPPFFELMNGIIGSAVSFHMDANPLLLAR